MRIAICDDETDLLPVLEQRIVLCFQHYGAAVTADTYDSGRALRSAVSDGTFYDVIFLDIDMPDFDGIELGTFLTQLSPSSRLIFVSNMESHVFRSFSAQPFRFVRKSCFNTELPEAVRAVIRKIEEPGEKDIVISFGSQKLRVNPMRIIYIEGCRNYVTIYMENEKQMMRHTLGGLEEQLSGYGFIRTHKSYLVNSNYIYRIDKNCAVLDNQQTIPISRHYLKAVKDSFQTLLTND